MSQQISPSAYDNWSCAPPSLDQTIRENYKRETTGQEWSESSRILSQNHLGAPYKTKVIRSGPGPLWSCEGHISNWKILSGEVLLTCTAESGAAMDQLTGKGKQRSRYVFKSLECVYPSFSPQHYFFLLDFDFLLLGLKKNLCIKSLSIVATR